MSNKRKKAKLREKRENRRLTEENRRLKPQDAVPADLSQQAPNNSYCPPLYYVDQPFRCVDCGVEEVWTAEQQKWYFEVVKGSIYGQAVRCRDCRKKNREIKER